MAKREANKAHARKINNAIIKDLIKCDPNITKDMAKNIVVAMAKGEIGKVKINY